MQPLSTILCTESEVPYLVAFDRHRQCVDGAYHRDGDDERRIFSPGKRSSKRLQSLSLVPRVLISLPSIMPREKVLPFYS